jgi:hypothetical protein
MAGDGLTDGESYVQSAGGVCFVCKERIEPGRAVQRLAVNILLRHPECQSMYEHKSSGWYRCKNCGNVVSKRQAASFFCCDCKRLASRKTPEDEQV